MNESSSFDPMKPGIAIDRCSMVELENEIAVTQLYVGSLCWIREFSNLPGLPLIFAEVLNDNRYTPDIIKRGSRRFFIRHLCNLSNAIYKFNLALLTPPSSVRAFCQFLE